LEFKADENDGCITDGIELMKRLSSGMEYSRQLGFNTTHLRFQIR